MRTTAVPKGTVAQLLLSTAMHALLTLSIGASQVQIQSRKESSFDRLDLQRTESPLPKVF